MTGKIACMLAFFASLPVSRPGRAVRTQADQGRCSESRKDYQC
jgi:hypothetical protein